MYQTPLNLGKMAPLNSTNKIRVLIIERHAAVRRALSKRLSATSNLDVIAAVSEPSAAVEHLVPDDVTTHTWDSDVVVLLGLQNGTDEEFFRILDVVQQMVRNSVTVVVLAPYADEIERLLLLQAGVSRYLLKHIDSMRLIEEIEAAAYHSPPQFVGN